MNVKQQLAYNLTNIIYSYNNTKNIRRFYKKIMNLHTFIQKNSNPDLYEDYKIDIKRVYNDIINADEDETIINDCINTIRKIILGLLYFE